MKNDWGAGFKTLCVLEYGELTKAFGLSRVWPRQFCLARSEQRQDHEVVGAMLFAADKHFAAGSAKPIEMFSSELPAWKQRLRLFLGCHCRNRVAKRPARHGLICIDQK